MNKVVELAKKVLAIPEGLDHKSLSYQAKAYLRALTPEQLESLKQEALAEAADLEDEESTKVQLLKKLAFTSTEAWAYARMRINSPGLRRMIARRALVMKILDLNTLPKGTTLPDIARMEDGLLKDASDEQVWGELFQNG